MFITGNLHFTYLKESDILSGEYKIYKVDIFNDIKDNTAGGSYTEIIKKAGEVFRYYTIDVWAHCNCYSYSSGNGGVKSCMQIAGGQMSF